MDYSIITESSPFWILPILMLSAALSWWQYRPERPHRDFTKKKLRVLALLRFLVYTILLILLLSPLIKFQHEKVEKPLLIWAQDNSQSILLNEDSTYLRNGLPKDLEAFRQQMNRRFDFHLYKFGNGVREVKSFDFADKHSDFSELFTHLKEDYPPNAVGALILASDGAFNKGNHPRYVIPGLSLPVYTINLGDTATVSDVVIDNLNFNRIAFLNHPFPVRCYLRATNYAKQKVHLRVKQGKTTVHEEEISIEGSDWYKEVEFLLTPTKSGLQRYRVELLPLEGEFTTRNNSRQMAVDVLNSKRKILLLYESYHPDLAALKSAIESDENLQVVYREINQVVDSVEAYDLAIYYQLPTRSGKADNWSNALKRKSIPLLVVIGAKTDLAAFTQEDWGLEFQGTESNTNLYEEVWAVWNTKFSLFEMDEDERAVLEAFPPLLAPFGEMDYSASADVALNQKLRSISTNTPLVLFTQKDQQKLGYIMGEGIWRWKLYNYMLEQNHEVYQNFIIHVIQYLALKERKDRMIIQMKRSYSEVEDIEVNVQLYNESYELLNQPELELEIRDADEKLHRYTISRTLDAYRMSIGALPVGNYHYKFTTLLDEKKLVREGSFAVLEEDVESLGVPANHMVLNQISELTGGKSYSKTQWDDLRKELKDRSDLKPVVYRENYFDNILNYLALGIAFLMLMSLEWFLKRYWGGY